MNNKLESIIYFNEIAETKNDFELEVAKVILNNKENTTNVYQVNTVLTNTTTMFTDSSDLINGVIIKIESDKSEKWEKKTSNIIKSNILASLKKDYACI